MQYENATVFVSRAASYSWGVREADVEHYASGREKVLIKPLEAQFEPVGLLDHEVEQGMALLSFTGLPEDKETEEKVHPRSRMGRFDSAAYAKRWHLSQEDHDLIVESLRKSELYGLDFIEIEKPKAKLPWKGYAKLSDPQRIVDVTLATETDPRDVLAFERENDNRGDVIAALVELVDDDAPTEVVISA